MTRSLPQIATCVALCGTLAGCALGYNRMLFMTKTNVGIDVDSKPPTAELSVARREGVIAPTFENGKTPPVAASFRLGGSWYSPRISAAFSGGDAALILSKLYGASTPATADMRQFDSSLCLQSEPRLSGLQRVLRRVSLLTEDTDDARPFFFATDTAYGIKVAWSGTTGAVPDTLRVGYNRKEFAYAPVFGRPITAAEWPEDQRPEGCKAAGFTVDTPSFVATIDTSPKLAALEQGDLRYVQFFATGKAAENFALQQDVRRVLVEELVPPQVKEAADRRARVRDLVDDIAAKFQSVADPAKKKAIVDEAVRLGLVDPDSQEANFLSRLGRAEGGGEETVQKLTQLKSFALQQ
jgi:hypothetical protein